MAAFEDELPFVHRMKATFLCTLWAWPKLYGVDNRVFDVNSAFKIKIPKFKVGFKNMPKLVRLWIGGNGRRCERRPLENSKAGVHNTG